MSLSRTVLRSALRPALQRRGMASAEAHAHPASASASHSVEGISLEGSEFLKNREAVRHHAQETTKLWRNISYFVCIPIIVAGYFWVQKVEGEHHAHVEHLKHEHGGALPPKPHYDYLNKRARAFPWGNNSLFFNPETQRDMNKKDDEE